MTFSTGVLRGAPGPTPAIFSMILGFQDPLPFPRSGCPSGSRGVGLAGPFALPGRSGIRPAIASWPDPVHGTAAHRIARAANDPTKFLRMILSSWTRDVNG